ncbi:MAG: transglutaminase domain-containing protein [Parasporobacterium sp.]|nr:transglutaminase domain-containing protein [Parasporobacterium sp.]
MTGMNRTLQPADRKTEVNRQQPAGRKTETNRQQPAGRKTEVNRRQPAGRRTEASLQQWPAFGAHIKRILRLALPVWVVLCFVYLAVPARVMGWQAPAYHESSFHEDAAIDYGSAKLDLSAVSQGYVAVSARSENRLKFQVLKEDITYTYDIHNDGTPSILPLQSGDGEYLFRVMENVTESKYAVMCSDSCQVVLEDPYQPFLRSNDYADYQEDSACVIKAREIAQGAGDALAVVSGVFEFICANVVYDQEKAQTVQSGYLPVPDETMESGRGICFDYASLAASMLRSQGIPAKVIFGYVSPDGLYHAWNMFYTEQTGWVTVDYQVSEGSWNRLDLTFSANGADGTFIGDGDNYSDLYFY